MFTPKWYLCLQPRGRPRSPSEGNVHLIPKRSHVSIQRKTHVSLNGPVFSSSWCCVQPFPCCYCHRVPHPIRANALKCCAQKPQVGRSLNQCSASWIPAILFNVMVTSWAGGLVAQSWAPSGPFSFLFLSAWLLFQRLRYGNYKIMVLQFVLVWLCVG